MSKTETTPELDLPGIPFGILTLEQFIASSEGQEVIQTMKTMSSDPYFLMVPFLTSYQYYDMLAQLNDMAIPMMEDLKKDKALLDVATRFVVEHLAKIVFDIGETKMKEVIRLLSPEPRQ